MNTQRGWKRILVVGSVALVAGVLLLTVLLVAQANGYGPDPGFVHLYVALWPLSLELMLVGAVLLALRWALRGFFAEGPSDGTRGFDR